MLKRKSMTAWDVLGGLLFSVPLALLLDLVTGFLRFHTPGVLVGGLVVEVAGDAGFKWNIVSFFSVAVLTDGILLFGIFSAGSLLFRRFRRRREKEEQKQGGEMERTDHKVFFPRQGN